MAHPGHGSDRSGNRKGLSSNWRAAPFALTALMTQTAEPYEDLAEPPHSSSNDPHRPDGKKREKGRDNRQHPHDDQNHMVLINRFRDLSPLAWLCLHHESPPPGRNVSDLEPR